jgi:hypothetical protein
VKTINVFSVPLMGAVFLITSLLLADQSAAAAKNKKLSFEQAWKICKQKLDKENVPGASAAPNERFIKGGACMKELGYDL